MAMLVRRFSARATAEKAAKYYAFFRDTLTPALRQIPGHHGALVLSRAGEPVEITVLTFWDSLESIAAFAGDVPNKAVVEPEARAILASFNDEIEQFTVELDLRS
jgi:heme-degrading monooxygenase HmoA